MRQVFRLAAILLASASFAFNIPQGASGVIEEMDKVIAASPAVGNLMKAQLYEYGYPDANIEQNLTLALEHYGKAFQEGSSVAGFKLGMYLWAEEASRNSQEGKPLYFFLKASEMGRKEERTPSAIAAGMYLISVGSYDRAVGILRGPADDGQATAELYMAFALKALGQLGQANMYLTRACNNPKRDVEIDGYCKKSSDIEDIHPDGSTTKRDENVPTSKSNNSISACSAS